MTQQGGIGLVYHLSFYLSVVMFKKTRNSSVLVSFRPVHLVNLSINPFTGVSTSRGSVGVKWVGRGTQLFCPNIKSCFLSHRAIFMGI